MNKEQTLIQINNFQNDLIELVKRYESMGMLPINIDTQMSAFGIRGLYGDTETEEEFRSTLNKIIETVTGV